MKQKLRRLALGVLFGMLALCALSLQAGAAETAFTDQALEGISLPKVLGAETFNWEGVDFHRVTIPRYVLERYETSSYEILPGQSDERVKAVKLALYSNDTYPDNEFVTYTQVRAGEAVESYFDAHLAALFETIYRFCGLDEKTACIDELTDYLLSNLPNLGPDMRHDIEASYKYELTKTGTYGTVARSGQLDNLYYFAQTDPDWAGEIF